MFHPVGHQSPSVYWRRRLVVLASIAVLIVLLVVTARALTSGGGDNAAAASQTGVTSSPPAPSSTTRKPSTSTKPSVSRTSSKPLTTSTAPVVRPCTAAQLAVSAAVGAPTYKVGARPVVELQVINTGAAPCVQDLADSQVELKVYNGESRVWGSHDCEIQAGSHPGTLMPNSPVRVQVTWSGLTSQPKCVGTRQRVGAGTYTLYATLSGKTGKAAQFSIS